MAKEMGEVERVRMEEMAKVEKLEKLNDKLREENRCLSSVGHCFQIRNFAFKVSCGYEEESLCGLKVLMFLGLRLSFSGFLGFEDLLRKEKGKYEQLQDEFERYKLKAQAVLKNRDISTTLLDNAGEIPRIASLPTVIECASCASTESDLRHTRSVVASLHEKLQTMEIDHANSKREYEEKCAQLQHTIAEMRTSHENLTVELRHQMQQRIAEMEAEMQKQRTRTLDILAEKEEELKMINTVLLSVRSQKLNQNDPMDPPQSISATRQHVKVRKTGSREFPDRSSPGDERRRSCGRHFFNLLNGAESYSSIVDELQIDRSLTQIPAVSSSTEAKNMFYEQELAKKDKLVSELRTAAQVAEFNARETQQASLTKDLLHHEMVEKLREEIKLLEGKLEFYSGDANMEYLRNIFIQLLHCESSSGKKHILKAIATVLKLSQNEIRHIDKR
ncbi:unnamed protein product [Enterobius vermicularis]|uniref:GRIP domain-containing protein n=1 Tax=Enterobius vermicularis TaxID=51028 RepID=A0A0N4USP4_ENTVE|nr:unnamed protein product [Enterobius vermicularis]